MADTSVSQSDAGSEWWRSYFDDTYAGIGLANVPAEKNERIASFLIDKLALQPGMRVLDQCCGIGRLSLPLAERGIEVVGVDQSAAYIDAARAAASQRGFSCRFELADARSFVASPPCDAAFNWFTSIGYSDDDDENIRVLQRLAESVKPGGRIAIDYLSILWVFANFQASRVVQRDIAGMIVLDETTYDARRGMLESNWMFISPDGRREERRVAVRAFMPHEIVAMLAASGFEKPDLFGTVDGEAFTRAHSRCIVVASRAG